MEAAGFALMDRSPQIEIVDLGDSGRVLILAEYDAECDTIRVNARAVERVRLAAGAAQADAFVTCAIAHESFHRAHPDASEAAVHEHVRAVIGGEPRRFEAFVRDAAPERS
jgi:hypothetical protein